MLLTNTADSSLMTLMFFAWVPAKRGKWAFGVNSLKFQFTNNFFLDGQLEILVAIIIAVYWESSRERSGYATDILRWKLSFLGEKLNLWVVRHFLWEGSTILRCTHYLWATICMYIHIQVLVDNTRVRDNYVWFSRFSPIFTMVFRGEAGLVTLSSLIPGGGGTLKIYRWCAVGNRNGHNPMEKGS